MLALALADNRRQQHELAAFGQRQYLIDHLADGLCFQRRVMVRAAGRADPRIEQTQVVVDLGDGAHGGARVVRGRFLLDRDRRGEPLNGVDVGLFHHREELARIRRKRFDVTALAFCVESVECQR